MLWSTIQAVTMIALFLYMINKAQFAEARKAALVPLAAGVADMLSAGLLHPGQYPALTLILAAMRLVIIGCCIGAMRRDALKAKQKARRRAMRRRMQLETAPLEKKPVLCPVSPSPRCA